MSCRKGPMVIAISGDPVSGKSSVIREIISRYIAEGYSESITEKKVIVRFWAGQLFRELASHSGIMVHDLTGLAREPGYTVQALRGLPGADKEFFDIFEQVALDKSIDEFVDTFMLERINKAREDLKDCENAIIIADSRIVGLLMKRDGEDLFNVRFTVKPEVAAERMMADIANRSGEVSSSATFEEVLQSVRERAERDRQRFILQYSANLKSNQENAKIDIRNVSNYNLVINTSNSELEETVSLLKAAIDIKLKKREALW